jgi:hypothetical protein
MVFAPLAAYVEATRPDGTVERIKLKRLTTGQARKAGLKRLRYTAFATAGLWCVTRIVSFDRAGQRLWRSGNLRKKTCSTESRSCGPSRLMASTASNKPAGDDPCAAEKCDDGTVRDMRKFMEPLSLAEHPDVEPEDHETKDRPARHRYLLGIRDVATQG